MLSTLLCAACAPWVLGGELKPETEALVGPDALATLDRYNFNCGFWGSNGIAAEQGFTRPISRKRK